MCACSCCAAAVAVAYNTLPLDCSRAATACCCHRSARTPLLPPLRCTHTCTHDSLSAVAAAIATSIAPIRTRTCTRIRTCPHCCCIRCSMLGPGRLLLGTIAAAALKLVTPTPADPWPNEPEAERWKQTATIQSHVVQSLNPQGKYCKYLLCGRTLVRAAQARQPVPLGLAGWHFSKAWRDLCFGWSGYRQLEVRRAHLNTI